MTFTIRRGDNPVDVACTSIDGIRQELATGRLKPTDLLWDPLRESWAPLHDVVPGLAQPKDDPSSVPTSGPTDGATPRGLERKAGAVAPTGADPRRRHPAVWVAVGLGIAFAAAIAVLVLQFLDDGRASVGASEATSGPAGAADLNLRTLEERVAQSALKKEKGESYVRDTYRLRLKENPADPVGMYLYARVATAEEKASLATQCTEQYPDYAWCWFLARHCAEESGDWETALQHVERAASLFEATEIVEARDRLRAARADWYDEWTGRRSATVRFELTSTKVRIQVEEMGKGFGCPVLCSKPDEFATLCYSVTWVHSGQSMEFDVKSLKCILDDGSQREAELVGSDKRVLEGRRHGQGGTAIAVVCVPRGRIVRSVFYWPAAYSMGGVLGEW